MLSGSHDFLGKITLTSQDLYALVNDNGRQKEHGFKLKPSTVLSAKENELATQVRHF